jgi:hypothetical protein
MAGTLCHAKQFAQQVYSGQDGKSHYELVPVDGGYDFPSWTTWEAMKKHCQAFGIATDSWPDFPEFESAIDLPCEEVERKNVILRAALDQLSEEEVSSHYLLFRICEYVRRGERIFFC